MAPFVKFLDSARRLIPMGMTRQQIFNFAKQEFGEVNQLMKKQIDNLFKPKKPVGKKDPDFDNTVEKMQFDDEGVPFNPRNPLKKAEGGIMRAEFASGGDYKMRIQEMAEQIAEDEFGKDYFDLSGSMQSKIYEKAIREINEMMADKADMMRKGEADGGRIGLKGGLTPSDYLKVKDMLNHYHKYKKSGKPKISKAKFAEEFFRENNAEGGRIGYAMGSEGIMQMASVDDPFYRSGDEDEHSFRMFNKPYKELNADELEEFREEMMRLMNKFASAPDPMDERNMVMENIAIQEFGKPLKDLSEDEIIQIDEMIDNMSKKPKQAPSIKLADGGITRVGLKEGPKDPRRRGFMKAAVGIASMLPFGIGKGVKVAAPVVKKAAEMSEPALAKIVETVMSAGKLISITGKRVKDMVTKRKLKNVEVEEDIADGSYIIKKDGKEIYYKPGRMDETGGIDDSIIEVIEDTVTKKAGGGIARMLGE